MAWLKEILFERYPSDLTDEEWEILESVLNKIEPYATGRSRHVALRKEAI